MQFESWQEFILMGGYGFYVWLSFAATFLCLGVLTWHTAFTRRLLRKEALKQAARAQRIQHAKQDVSL
ncbi:heme exporter protein CcmD [Aliidiomarina minuta]|uniref:Heme exporter protein D n=1 Tax=Aliidiomarina minuta TaxID=880057 RepID=A0A432W8F6_9GAMM|nr:heme exporter protein CcmD [Aliidiomarina minuta]RUO26355.1 heme exporter protein CcmD [Aliidiomarina minuta]